MVETGRYQAMGHNCIQLVQPPPVGVAEDGRDPLPPLRVQVVQVQRFHHRKVQPVGRGARRLYYFKNASQHSFYRHDILLTLSSLLSIRYIASGMNCLSTTARVLRTPLGVTALVAARGME